MRILCCLAHFFNPKGGGKYGSLQADSHPRIEALRRSILSFHQLYSLPQIATDYFHRAAKPANHLSVVQLEIIICTTQNYHILSELSLPSNLYKHHPTNVEPMLLGFECQGILRDCLGQYDYYCFLEDDLILHDPWFFIKLNWFSQQAGNLNLLQPNRYEVSSNDPIRKTYIDGELGPQVTARFQNVSEQPELKGKILGIPVTFCRTLNPHSGCYFLNDEQMAYWVKQPYFLDRDTSFVGPLESAATLGIMKTFKVYKPAPENANFLEIQHFGQVWSDKMLKLLQPE